MAKDRIDQLQEMGFEINGHPQLLDLRIVGQTLKGFEVKYQISGMTNVDDLGQLNPETMAIGLFDWLYRLHGQDYEAFSRSCKEAVKLVKEKNAEILEAEIKRIDGNELSKMKIRPI